jgi:hypothetical protein
MFYCDNCRQENSWPESIVTSFGRCEICGENHNCYDIPSHKLPKPLGQMAESIDGSVEGTELEIARARIDELEKGMLHLSNLANEFIYNRNDGITMALLKTAVVKYEKLAKKGKIHES